ncbi:MAG TPA: AMP-binding protein, partial [Acidimicrobiales bacterium]|nr:AMP-binding protein [Acidimicrobiales bacterium]
MGEVMDGVLSGSRFLGRQEIVERAERLASGLKAAGVGAGDAVALLVRNDPVHIEASLAAARVGAYPVPINWHWRGEEVGYLLRDCEAKFLIAHADLLTDVAEAIPETVTVLSVPTPPELKDAFGISERRALPRAQDLDYRQWVSAHEPIGEALADATALSMIYTSGTTGRPKGVQRLVAGAGQVTEMQKMLLTAFGLGSGVRSVIPAPMYHSAPNAYALVAFGLGGFMVL